MAAPPLSEFGKRRPAAIADTVPQPKRSGHVALLLTGSLAVGGSAYALMPQGNCDPSPPGMAAALGPQTGVGCSPRGSSFGGHGYWGGSSRYSFFGGDTSSNRSGTPANPDSGGVTRGGFGGFIDSISSHFSRGG